MFGAYRETHDLLVDYAEALRDGNLPTFLKSLTRFEGREVLPVQNFRKAAEIVRVLNGIAFAEEMTIPSMDLFIARVSARIVSRAKNAKKPSISAKSRVRRPQR